MFINNKFIYIQLQKTGCTHIAMLFNRLFDGKITTIKHNSATPEQLASNLYFISSIRNPWEWYLSLWSFGAKGNGGLKNRLIKNSKTDWKSAYNSKDSIKSFRKWLQMIHDTKNSTDLGEGYGLNNDLHKLCGFMTYRYLYLCVNNFKLLKNNSKNFNYHNLSIFEQKNCYIDYFIRQENLEQSFISISKKFTNLTDKQLEFILNSGRSNEAKRNHSLEMFYNQKSIDLISRREKLIIDKFKYKPPNI